MGVEVEQGAEGLHRDDRPGDRIGPARGRLDDCFDGLVSTPGKGSQEVAVVPKEGPDLSRHREDYLSVRDRLQHFLGYKVGELRLALLLTRRAQAPTLTREGHQELVAAVTAPDAGETVIENPAFVVPFVLAMLGDLLVITYLPFLSTWIPKLLRLY